MGQVPRRKTYDFTAVTPRSEPPKFLFEWVFEGLSCTARANARYRKRAILLLRFEVRFTSRYLYLECKLTYLVCPCPLFKSVYGDFCAASSTPPRYARPRVRRGPVVVLLAACCRSWRLLYKRCSRFSSRGLKFYKNLASFSSGVS